MIAMRPVLLFNMGVALQGLGQLDEATGVLEEAKNLAQALDNVHVAAGALGHLAEVQIVRGQLQRAADTCRQGIELVGKLAGQSSPLSGLMHVQLGQLAYERNELETAVRHLLDGIDVAKPWRNREALLPGYEGLIRAYRALGRDQEAMAAEKALEEMLAADPIPADSVAKAAFAWLRTEQGQLEEAWRWLESATFRFDEEPLHEAEAITMVRLLLLRGKLEEANRWLDLFLGSAESGERWGRVIGLLIFRAMTLDAQGEREAAISAISRALAMAESQGYVRSFLDGGQQVAGLLWEAAQRGATPEYVDKLLSSFSTDEKPVVKMGSLADSTDTPLPLLLEPLSEREVEVLQLIADGLSNKEIAARLYLAPGTIKVHAHNIYSKLGVNGRTQAVAKARSLKLLP
jgi:LuxR family maltose regulon positive regulatory protein